MRVERAFPRKLADDGRAILRRDHAPPRIAAGSHHEVARVLEPHAEQGMTVLELAAAVRPEALRREVLATGAAGTVCLCHPHLVHAAQRHRGKNPRFMAQPPLLPAPGLDK